MLHFDGYIKGVGWFRSISGHWRDDDDNDIDIDLDLKATHAPFIFYRALLARIAKLVCRRITSFLRLDAR